MPQATLNPENIKTPPILLAWGVFRTRDGTRTRTSVKTRDFKSLVATITPLWLSCLHDFIAMVFASIIIRQRMAVGAKQLQVSEPMVVVYAIGVVKL